MSRKIGTESPFTVTIMFLYRSIEFLRCRSTSYHLLERVFIWENLCRVSLKSETLFFLVFSISNCFFLIFSISDVSCNSTSTSSASATPRGTAFSKV
jgi:hypothetical protein